MYNYTNSFRCSFKNDGSEFAIQFLQESPAYDNQNKADGMQSELVTSVVMNVTSAKALRQLIDSALSSLDGVDNPVDETNE